MKALSIVALLLVGSACSEPAFTESVLLGGTLVPAHVLEQGRGVYGRYCQPCHGVAGDGRGTASFGLWPPPRDFRLAKFKFAGVLDRGLPGDKELERIIRRGLRGTAMPAWTLQDSELHALVQYIKSFSLEGKGFRSERLKVKEPPTSADPYQSAAQIAGAIEVGRELYHASFQCSSCHPAYVGADEHRQYQVSMRTDAPFDSVPKWSENYRSVLLPPDFLRHPMRSVAVEEVGPALDHSVEDIYRSIAYGLQGPMPGFVHLGEDKVWAVAHYVKSLADLRESPAGTSLRKSLVSAPESESPSTGVSSEQGLPQNGP